MESSAVMATMHLFPDWLNSLLRESYYEDKQLRVKLVKNEIRNAIWQTCMWFGCETRGVPGIACQLLERYLFLVLHGYHNAEMERLLQQSLQAKLPLLIAVCVMLASKMNNSCSPVVAKLVHIIFLCKRINFSMEDIIASEFKVYSTLGYRLPLWTNVEKGELLAVQVGIPIRLLGTVAMLIDIAELKRYAINAKVRQIAKLSFSGIILDILSLHLTAGAVANIALFYEYSGSDLVVDLARLINMPTTYIKCIRDVAHAEILTEISQRTERSLKRSKDHVTCV